MCSFYKRDYIIIMSSLAGHLHSVLHVVSDGNSPIPILWILNHQAPVHHVELGLGGKGHHALRTPQGGDRARVSFVTKNGHPHVTCREERKEEVNAAMSSISMYTI